VDPIYLTVLLVVALGAAAAYVYKKRKAAGITGIKSVLTSICFFLISVVNLLAYWFDFLGIISWGLTLLLVLAGAYFTKYLPREV
jgi:CHASE2 domain-containing sensor protein